MTVFKNEIADTIPCYGCIKIKLNPIIQEKITSIIICWTMNNSCGRVINIPSTSVKCNIISPTIGNTNTIQIHTWLFVDLYFYTCNTGS